MNFSNSPILVLFAFNRPDRLTERLSEIKKIGIPNTFVTVDYCDELTSRKLESILIENAKSWPSNLVIKYRLLEERQGLVKHLISTIDKFVNEFNGVIVVEDDITISREFYASAVNYLKNPVLGKNYAAYCGFSIFPLFQRVLTKNYLRTSRYFACWGWAISRENWEGYKFDLRGIHLEAELKKSTSWNALSGKQKKTWLGRFAKAQHNPLNTWDIQFQYHVFMLDKPVLLPLQRQVENVGFSDRRSTHTKGSRPKVLGKVGFSEKITDSRILNTKVSKILTEIEGIIFFEETPLIKRIGQILKKI